MFTCVHVGKRLKQCSTAGSQPSFGVAEAWAGRLDEPPEASGVILLMQMHQLVHQDVIPDVVRHLDQTKIQRDVAAPRAGAPPRSLVADTDACDLQTVACGELVQPRDQFFVCDVTQVVLDQRSHRHPPVERDPPICVTHDGCAIVNRQCHRAAAKHDGRTGAPVPRRMLCGDAGALPFDPAPVLTDERLGLAPRSAARDGDAQRTIGLNAKDVSPRSANPNEVDLRADKRLRCRTLTLWNRPRLVDAAEWEN